MPTGKRSTVVRGHGTKFNRLLGQMAKISLHVAATAVLGLALFALAGGAMLPTRVVDSADAKNGVVDAGQIGAHATTLCYYTLTTPPLPPLSLCCLPPFHSTHPTLPREPTFGASFPDHAVIASPLSSSLAATKQDKATTGGQVGGDQREDRGGEGGEDEGPDMTNILNIIGALFGGEGRPIHAMPSWRLSILSSGLYPSCSPALLLSSP
jgi:hypothetical protein